MMIVGKMAIYYVIAHSTVINDGWISRQARHYVNCPRCPKCLIAVILVDVELKSWAFNCIYENFQQHIAARAQKRWFINFLVNFGHHSSITWPRFLCGVRNCGDVAAFLLTFCIFVCDKSAVFLFPVCFTEWPESISHSSTSTPSLKLIWPSTAKLTIMAAKTEKFKIEFLGNPETHWRKISQDRIPGKERFRKLT